MLRLRYTSWDGSQRIRLDPEKVFEQFAEALSGTDDVRQALEWMMRQGMELADGQLMGLDELLQELRDQLQKRQESVNVDHALDEPQGQLEDILRRERDTLTEREGPGDAVAEMREKKAFLGDLPAKLSEAIARIAQNYAFEDGGAERDFKELLDKIDDIRKVEDLKEQWGDRLKGDESLDFEQALDLAAELAALMAMQSALMRGDLEGIDPSQLGDLLGPQAAEDLGALKQAMSMLVEAGFLIQREGRLELSAKGIRRIGQLALQDIYQALLRDRPGAHEIRRVGAAEEMPEGVRPHEPGEPLDLALVPTLMNAVRRQPGATLGVEPRDFEVHESRQHSTASTVLLLDMSWSMSWEGRFAAAKKVALALESLIRTRYPRDFFGIVGFYTRAVELRPQDLPEASWNMGDPFTNLQDALRMGSDLLRRHPSRNQQLIVVTDGQPTAYFADGRLHCEWPLSFGGVSRRAAQETLREVERVTKRGITINTFMLDDSLGLRAFVEQMTRINKGRALYSRPDRLGEYLLVDYLARKKKKV
ncbi:MAG: VWA domain-containing protein [Candidatus Binatia bacterium]|nr:VWA domain-containing protein [Candidatus Binatia bacterium]